MPNEREAIERVIYEALCDENGPLISKRHACIAAEAALSTLSDRGVTEEEVEAGARAIAKETDYDLGYSICKKYAVAVLEAARLLPLKGEVLG